MPTRLGPNQLVLNPACPPDLVPINWSLILHAHQTWSQSIGRKVCFEGDRICQLSEIVLTVLITDMFHHIVPDLETNWPLESTTSRSLWG